MKYLKPRRANIRMLRTKHEQGPRHGKRWMRYARWYKSQHPICEECGERLTQEVHHIRPVSEAPQLTFDESNVRGLCRPCHAAKHR